METHHGVSLKLISLYKWQTCRIHSDKVLFYVYLMIEANALEELTIHTFRAEVLIIITSSPIHHHCGSAKGNGTLFRNVGFYQVIHRGV